MATIGNMETLINVGNRAYFNKERILKNTILTTASGLIVSNGLQIANNSYHFVDNNSMIVNPSQIVAVYYLARIAVTINILVLDEILPNSMDHSRNLSIRDKAGIAVFFGTTCALAASAGASLIEVIVFSYLAIMVDYLRDVFAHKTGIEALEVKKL